MSGKMSRTVWGLEYPIHMPIVFINYTFRWKCNVSTNQIW